MIISKLNTNKTNQYKNIIQSSIFMAGLIFSIGNSYAQRCTAIDGDTLRCGAQRVRLANVYAAEKNEAGGLEAKQRLADLVNGHDVQIHRVATDVYGRTVAKVSVNGREIVQSDIGPKAGRGTGYKPHKARRSSTAIKKPRSHKKYQKTHYKRKHHH